MEYGCIGEHLKHSFSKEIHNLLCDYDYCICEVAPENLDDFMKKRDFKAINVTIPYKEKVLPYLKETDIAAKKIGAVNTVINKNEGLCGYNTDFYGMTELIKKIGLKIGGKKVLIAGTGGTSKTAAAVCESLGAKEIIKVSRTACENCVCYDDVYKTHTDSEIIINTTPVGMFPKNGVSPLDISKFPNLCGVADAVYNPLRTKLVREAQKAGIPCGGGLYMLTAQAVRACELFTDAVVPKERCDEVYSQILFEKENIILIGMPGSGKTTIGKAIAKRLGRKFIDTDEEIKKFCNCEISELFEKHGEEYFRDIESKVISEISKETGVVIATGGGAVLREKNVDELRQNGRIVFADADIDEIFETSDRPLSDTREKLLAMYEYRYPIYCEKCDVRVKISRNVDENAMNITNEFRKLLK